MYIIFFKTCMGGMPCFVLATFCHKTSLQFTWRIILHIYIYIYMCIIHHGCINWPCHVSQGARSLRDSIEEVHGLGTSDALLEAASGACVIILRRAVSWQLPDWCKTYMFQDGWMTHIHIIIYIYLLYYVFCLHRCILPIFIYIYKSLYTYRQ